MAFEGDRNLEQSATDLNVDKVVGKQSEDTIGILERDIPVDPGREQNIF
ncbi:hypothetical protein [Aquibacillus koreensis]|nr:hypothetical protein [Aquibacillus koreensis]